MFTFFCALLSPRCKILVVDPLQLTRYRLHGANGYVFIDTEKKNPSSDKEIRISEFLSREKRSTDSIMRMTTATDDYHDAENLKVVKKMVGYESVQAKSRL